jgi:hypothetical protein
VTDISSSLRNKGLPHLDSLFLSSFNSRCSSPLGFFLPPYRFFLLFRQLCGLFSCFGFFFSLKLFLLFLPGSFFCFGFPLFDLCLFFFREWLFLDWSVEMAAGRSVLVRVDKWEQTYTWAGTPLSHHNSLPTAAALPIG